MKTIYELRKEGFKVRCNHFRYFNGDPSGKIKVLVSNFDAERLNYNKKFIYGKGGKTVIDLTTPNGLKTVQAEASCSLMDNFDRKMGNSIALGRCLKQLGI